MYFSKKTLLLLLFIVAIIVTFNLIMKNMKRKEYYGTVSVDTPFPDLNKMMKRFNNIYDEEIASALGLNNNIKKYYNIS